jgi:hypothetical protein
MGFIKQNVNPKNRKVGDCVVRAIAVASGKTWDEVFDGLCLLAKQEKAMPNSKEVFEIYLQQIGFKKHKMPRKANGSKYIAGEWASQIKGVAVIQVARHLTAAVEQSIVDIWDCGGKSVYNYYTR